MGRQTPSYDPGGGIEVQAWSKMDSVRYFKKEHLVDGLLVVESGPMLESGLETPLLLVHGACHGWWAFERWMAFFSVFGWRAYSMSLRNHAGSRTVPEKVYLRMKAAEYVDDILRVQEWIQRPVVLLGHSMGGILAQKAAERSTPKALILVASVGPGQLGVIREPLPTHKPILFPPEEAKRLWFHRIDDREFQAIYEKLVPESPSVMNEYSGGQLHVDRSKIRCPVLVVGAQYDRTVVHPYERIARFYGCEALEVPEAGHDLILEPEGFKAAVAIHRWLLSTLPDEGLVPVAVQESG